MPGVDRLIVDQAGARRRARRELGIPAHRAVSLSTEAALRDEHGTEALNPDNLVCRAVRAIKADVPRASA